MSVKLIKLKNSTKRVWNSVPINGTLNVEESVVDRYLLEGRTHVDEETAEIKAAEKTLDEMTIKELKAYAEGKSISVTTTKQADILAEIKAAEAAAEEEVDPDLENELD